MNKEEVKTILKDIPNTPGVYLFKDREDTVLYVGKATNLRERLRQYFTGNDSRGERIFTMVALSEKIDTEETDTVLEALILEAELIKKYQPKYNIEGKDDKSFSYFVVTKEDFPRIVIMRQTDLKKEKLLFSHKEMYGPYTSIMHMKIALKIIRKIFPIHTIGQKTEKGCLDYQMHLCPGPYDDAISKNDYRKNITNIKLFFRGRKKYLIKKLTREMTKHAKNQEYERAAKIRNQIFSLHHINDIAFISQEKFIVKNLDQSEKIKKTIRIEGYDISNISGCSAVASMVVFEGGEPKKQDYRKFKIKTIKAINDVAMMVEVVERRLKHTEWRMPDLIVLDGGKGHLHAIEDLLKEKKIFIPLLGLAKGPTRKKLDLYLSKKFPPDLHVCDITVLEKVRDESHRFAISFHRKTRDKQLFQ